MTYPSIALIILTYNAAGFIEKQIKSIQSQTLHAPHLLVIDSSSQDATPSILKELGVRCHQIDKQAFNHGTTRQLATTLVDADIYVYFTQDAILVNEYALENLVKAFADEKVGCAYGRQLPHADSSVLAAHVRLFNYPAMSSVKSYEDRKCYGIKTCFASNSFAAYRKKALQSTGGFPQDTIICEDVYVAAKMLMNGWKIAYQADAMVYHSHNYSLVAEFERYFDIGVFHANNKWFLETFGQASDEGMKYVLSGLQYCVVKRDYFVALEHIFRAILKYFGYQLGLHYKLLPKSWIKFFSMDKFYWDRRAEK